MSNTIKNLIQQSKNEPAIQNALNSYEATGETNGNVKSNRSGSMPLNRKKSSEASSPSHRQSPSSSPKSAGLYKLNEAEAKTSLSDIYISPSGEMRNAAKRASIKIQQQQQQNVLMQYADLLENSKEPPPIPTSPLPSLMSEQNIDLNVGNLNLNGE